LAVDVEEFYQRYGPMVLRRCRRLLRHPVQAEDAMQEVFVQLLRHQGRLDDAAPSALLLRIATNVCLNRLRSERRHPEDADDDLVLRIAGAPHDDESRLGARQILGRLFGRQPESSRAIAVMHLLDGLTLAEVAREVGMSVSGVRKRLDRLRMDVREVAATTGGVS